MPTAPDDPARRPTPSPPPDGPGSPPEQAETASSGGLSRRRFLGVVGAAAAGAGLAACGGSPARHGVTPGRAAPRRVGGASTRRAGSATTARTPSGVEVPVSPALIEENAKPGTPWWVTTAQVPRSIEGFAGQVSAVVGDRVPLFVNTTAHSFHVEAYRIGWYHGVGGRLVWRSAEVPGVRQPQPTLAPGVNTVECSWQPSLQVPIDGRWFPGAYLLKLVGDDGEQQFVPLCVRDDTSTAAVRIQHCVTTWQAYNLWGGYSLYYGRTVPGFSFTQAPGSGDFANRARIVSFDRPYSYDWAFGAAHFVGNEMPVVLQAERLGLDVTYATDVDLHRDPAGLLRHRCLLSLGHDEYWSRPMRDGARNAVEAGVNLAFLGANACYRQIRLQSSPVGPLRHQVCYKSAAEDPLYGHDNSLVTVNWPQPPVNDPECKLIGSTYQDIGAKADMVVADPGHWLLAGTGLTAGQHLANVVQGEFDRYMPGEPGPSNVDVVAHSLVANRNGNYSDVTWYTTAHGGGVLDTGNASWVVNLIDDTGGFPADIIPPLAPAAGPVLRRIMENVYSVLGAGPASATHPSTGTWRAAYEAAPSA